MKPYKLKDILKITKGKLISGSDKLIIRTFSTDSRTLKKSDFFVPVRGENFNGHDYIKQAIEKGISGFFYSEKINDELLKHKNITAVKVKDTLKAYMAIGADYRSKFIIKSIGITGSCGKTTAKEMVFEVLNKKFKTLKTLSSINSEIGLPATVFNLDKTYKASVMEMGMRAPGQIRELAKIVQPDIGIITIITPAHFEFFGSIEAIIKAKGELLEEIKSSGTLLLNADDPNHIYFEKKFKGRVLKISIEKKSDLKADNIRSKGLNGTYFDIKIKNKVHTFFIPLLGKHNVYNALFAIECGLIYKVPPEEIKKALRSYSQQNMRMQKIKLKNGAVVFNDAYNSNPGSARSAVETLKLFGGKYRKIIVLADMLELGKITEESHRDLGRITAKADPDIVYVTGNFRKYIYEGAVENGYSKDRIFMFDNVQKTAKHLAKIIKKQDLIILKASRKVGLEKIIEVLNENADN